MSDRKPMSREEAMSLVEQFRRAAIALNEANPGDPKALARATARSERLETRLVNALAPRETA